MYKCKQHHGKNVLYTVSSIFPHTYCTDAFTPALHFSSLCYSYKFFPIKSRFSPLPYTALHFISLHFTSLHFTSLHFTFRWFSLHFTSLHYTFRWFSLHFTSLLYTFRWFQEETKSRFKSGNACYHSVQNLLSSRLRSTIWRLRYTEL